MKAFSSFAMLEKQREISKKPKDIPTIKLSEGQETATNEELGRNFEDIFEISEYLDEVNELFECLAEQATRGTDEERLRMALHEAIAGFGINLSLKEASFRVENRVTKINETDSFCEVRATIDKVPELLEDIAPSIEQIDAILRALTLMRMTNEKILALREKLKNAEQALEKVRQEKSSLMRDDVSENEAAAQIKRVRELSTLRIQTERNRNAWRERIEKLEAAMNDVRDVEKELATAVPDLSEKLKDGNIPALDVRAKIEEAIKKASKNVVYRIHYPSVAAKIKHEEAMCRQEVQKRIQRESALVRLRIGVAFTATAAFVGGMLWYKVQTNTAEDAKAEEMCGDPSPEEPVDCTKKRVAEFFAKYKVPEAEVAPVLEKAKDKEQLYKDSQELSKGRMPLFTTEFPIVNETGDALLRYVPTADHKELVAIIFGSKARLGFEFENPRRPGMKEMSDNPAIVLDNYCGSKEPPRSSFRVVPEKGQPVRVAMRPKLVRSVCSNTEEELKNSFGYRVTETPNGEKRFMPLDRSPDPGANVLRAKKELGAFIQKKQRSGAISPDADTSFLEKAASLQDLEEGFVAAMGMNAMAIRRASSSRTDFYVNRELKEGLQIIYSFVLTHVMFESEAGQLHTADTLPLSFGMHDSFICKERADFGIVVQPGEERRKEARAFYEYDLTPWRTTNCSK